MSPTKSKPTPPAPFTGRRLLVLMLGVFAIVLGANFTMAYFARESFTGVTSPKAYEEGLAYNQALKSKATLEAQGLTLHRTETAEALVYHIGLTTPAPLANATLTFTRPLGELAAQTVTCTVQDTTLTCPKPVLAQGQWHLTLSMQMGAEGVSLQETWMHP